MELFHLFVQFSSGMFHFGKTVDCKHLANHILVRRAGAEVEE